MITFPLFSYESSCDELVKSRNSIEFVIPAKAGIQLIQDVLDPGFRRGDASRDFLRVHQVVRKGTIPNPKRETRRPKKFSFISILGMGESQGAKAALRTPSF